METIAQIFDSFCNANTFHSIVDHFNQLCEIADIKQTNRNSGKIFYNNLRSNVNSWKAQSLWAKLDKRACQWEYSNGTACKNTNVLIIGAGPCGLRAAIEIALLGCRVVVLEKRDGFTRNNVLHLWPFLIHDLKSLGAKKFFGKFCAGSIDHISIRTLQCILLKVALLVGVEIYSGVEFFEFIEPSVSIKGEKSGWKARISPHDHPCSEFVFDVCISADGKRNTMQQFKRKEFRGKLAIAITANFINRNRKEEACIEEISGVAYIFNQKFFRDLNAEAGIDLENIVYYRDETHYFVMTAKKMSLLNKHVLIQDFEDPERLLSRDNVNQEALLAYAREAADISTCHKLPNLEYAHNHYGQPDVAMFDFTSIFASESASRVIERDGFKLLLGLVGDTLLEPFWPTGSGCARGFLSAFDATWMVRAWGSGKMSPLEILAERESIYQLLSQTTPENLNKNYLGYTIDPNTRYVNLQSCSVRPSQVRNLYDCTDSAYLDEIVCNSEQNSKKYDIARNSYNILRWCQKQLQDYKNIVIVNDLSVSFKNGIAFACLVHKRRPSLIDVYSLNPSNIEFNNQMVFDLIYKEFGIKPYLTVNDMTRQTPPDRNLVAAYLNTISDYFTREDNKILQLNSINRQNPSSITQKINQKKYELEKSLKRNIDDIERDPYHNRSYKYERFDEFDLIEADLLNCKSKEEELNILSSGGQSKVSVLAKGLVKKLSGDLPSKTTNLQKQFHIAKPRQRDLCFFCKQQVYLVEKFTAENFNFHRDCFRCHYCNALLRISCYSYQRLPTGGGRFYCVQHQGLQQPKLQPILKTLSNSKITSLPKVPSFTEPYIHMASELKHAPPKFESRHNERAEYFTESEMEETELNQTKHNLSTRKFFDSASSSSEEEELQFSVNSGSEEEPDLTWAELARNYSNHLRKTRQNSLNRQAKDTLPIAYSSESSVSGSGTETVGASDADWETDEDRGSTTPEDLNSISYSLKTEGFIKVPISFPTNIAPKENKPQPSTEIMRNRMAFFSTISQPVRIDARTFLGLDGQKNPHLPDTSEEKENLAGENIHENIDNKIDSNQCEDMSVSNSKANLPKSSPPRNRIRKNSETKKKKVPTATLR